MVEYFESDEIKTSKKRENAVDLSKYRESIRYSMVYDH